MHDHDELMRLAKELDEVECADSIDNAVVRKVSAGLRTLAQGAKTGGVAVWQYRQVAAPNGWHDLEDEGEAQGMTSDGYGVRKLYATPPPAAQHEGTAVDDAMVERRAREMLAAEYEREGIEFVPNAIRTDPILTTAEARAVRAISAALIATQPKTEDTPK